MTNDYLGQRFKDIRIEIFEESQEFFCENINEYILKNYGKNGYKTLHFTQPLLSSFEKNSNIIFTKYNLLITYLYSKKNINPAWLILKNNQNHPKFLKNIEIDKNIVDLISDVDQKQKDISDNLNSIRIIIDNSVFKK